MAEKKHIQHLRSKVVENGKPKLPTSDALKAKTATSTPNYAPSAIISMRSDRSPAAGPGSS